MTSQSSKQRVVLNPADCDIDFEIKGDGLYGSRIKGCSEKQEKALAYYWLGCRADVGISGGKYCFGCKVVSFQPVEMKDTVPEDRNVCRVGISRGEDVVGSLGETYNSFGYESSGTFWNFTKSPYGEKFKSDDTIVCAVSLEENPLASVSFFKNRELLGTPMKFNVGVDSQVKTAFFPHVLLKNVEVEMQFSVEDGLVLPDGFKSWASALEDGNAIMGPVFDEPKDCEVMLMVGMPLSGKTTWANRWVKEHPEKRYVLVGIETAFDLMKVSKATRKKRKNVCGESDRISDLFNRAFNIWDSLIYTVTTRAATSPRNYILDDTYVEKHVRQRELKHFNMFKKIAVVVFPKPEDVKTRLLATFEYVGSLDPGFMRRTLAMFRLPVSKDVPGSDELFDEVMFEELDRDESHKLLGEMRCGQSNPYSEENFDEDYPCAPTFGGNHVLSYPTLYNGASPASTSVATIPDLGNWIGGNNPRIYGTSTEVWESEKDANEVKEVIHNWINAMKEKSKGLPHYNEVIGASTSVATIPDPGNWIGGNNPRIYGTSTEVWESEKDANEAKEVIRNWVDAMNERFKGFPHYNEVIRASTSVATIPDPGNWIGGNNPRIYSTSTEVWESEKDANEAKEVIRNWVDTMNERFKGLPHYNEVIGASTSVATIPDPGNRIVGNTPRIYGTSTEVAVREPEEDAVEAGKVISISRVPKVINELETLIDFKIKGMEEKMLELVALKIVNELMGGNKTGSKRSWLPVVAGSAGWLIAVAAVVFLYGWRR